MRNSSVYGLACLALLLSIGAGAGSVSGTVDYLHAGEGWTDDNVYFLVKMSAAPSGQPDCATDERFAINPATEAGKTMLSMLLAAKAASQ